jgi:hypothetical protein
VKMISAPSSSRTIHAAASALVSCTPMPPARPSWHRELSPKAYTCPVWATASVWSRPQATCAEMQDGSRCMYNVQHAQPLGSVFHPIWFRQHDLCLLNLKLLSKQQLLVQITANHIRQVTELRWACNFDGCGMNAMQHKNSLLVVCLGRLCKVSYCICTITK